ncbi:MAG: nucleotide exchange factor GrpE [Candidatus Longimicrobiales bacterium M2_2A_002]
MTEQDRNETIHGDGEREEDSVGDGRPSTGQMAGGAPVDADPPGDPMEADRADDVESAGSVEVEDLRRELESLNDRHLRLAAEFDNYRKRNQRDRQALASRLQADLVGSLLDVLDDLQRVAEGGEDVEAEGVLEGVRLVEKKMMTVLESAGLSPVDAEGSRFDPELMEALGMVPTDDAELDGQVADVFQRGYMLRDMLLRPARVRVYQHSENE